MLMSLRRVARVHGEVLEFRKNDVAGYIETHAQTIVQETIEDIVCMAVEAVYDFFDSEYVDQCDISKAQLISAVVRIVCYSHQSCGNLLASLYTATQNIAQCENKAYVFSRLTDLTDCEGDTVCIILSEFLDKIIDGVRSGAYTAEETDGDI